MILRIVEEADDEKVVLRLIGRIETEHVRDLKDQLEDETRRIVPDLSEIKLANQTAVRFLRLSEDKGIQLQNCPAYIREWNCGDRRSGDETELSSIATKCRWPVAAA